MQHTAVIFLAFANSSTAPLDKLSQEDDAIYKILLDRSSKQGHFHVHRESHLDLNNLRTYLSEFRNRVILFHYGGHADSDEILLKDESVKSGGLAEMLAEQENLRLVFLNGCSSAGQVEYLLELGVPAVIATHEPIKDGLARDFARHFYQVLEMGQSYAVAFEEAARFVRAAGKEIHTSRAIDLSFLKKDTAEESWGLFLHPDKEALIHDKLPGLKRSFEVEDFHPNALLIEKLWDSLLAEGIVSEGKKMKLSRKRMAILNNFPAPLAENLRKLLVPLGDEGEGFDKIGLPRLQQLAKTYQVLMELLCFILLAQVWEAKEQEARNKDSSKLNLPSPTAKEIQKFLRLTEEERKTYRFTTLIELLLESFVSHQLDYFVDELSELPELIKEGSSFRKACLHFDLLSAEIQATHIDESEWAAACQQAEVRLAELYGQFSFLANYTLATIKNIDVEKYRHTPEANFRHVVVRLVDLLGGMEEENENLSRFLDSRSVLLLKEDEEEEIVGFLNLSPFIVDENAFVERTDVSKIFFFHHFDKIGNSWCYEYVNEPRDPLLRAPGEVFGILGDQFVAFEKLFIG